MEDDAEQERVGRRGKHLRALHDEGPHIGCIGGLAERAAEGTAVGRRVTGGAQERVRGGQQLNEFPAGGDAGDR